MQHKTAVHGTHLLRYQRPSAQGWKVVPHPSYRGTVDHAGSEGTYGGGTSTKFRLLFAGGARVDKGADHVPNLVELLDASFSLTVTDPAAANPRLILACRNSGVELNILPQPVSDFHFVEAYCQSDVVIAPYINASDSGTVTMAMTTRTPVLAFDSGVLASTLTSAALIPQDIGIMAAELRRWAAVGPPECFQQLASDRDSLVANRWEEILS